MSESGSEASGDEALGHLVVADSGTRRNVPIFDQLFVGRECAGISDRRRLVIADPEVSRNHLEIRLDPATDQAFVIDTSTNGTHVNGSRLERAVPLPLKPGDEIRVGEVAMTFASSRFTTATAPDSGLTNARISQSAMVMVVGDITNYSTMSQVTDHTVIAESLRVLWRELGLILRAYRGTLSNYAGDAMYAIWELRSLPDAELLAIDFALAANERVRDLAPDLPMRGLDGSPIRMGWGVVQGMAALAAMTRSVEVIVGDSTNVAFRLAGIAGRDGREPVMVTGGVYAATKTRFAWGAAERVEIKGRSGLETVFPVIARTDQPPVPIASTARIPTRPT
ncbi:MAG: adenylate/guanylate cyclase domain-containing protein [Mycolicibacterium cosmeticum]|nr:adenylate/guanylate cyclase domain-containing protein [Mycolicibacterium cosmeticum]